MNENLKGKKLLIIGGAYQHCKLVEAAREMGVETYVLDYLPVEASPAKQIADHYSMLNITDYEEIVELCKKEHIDGVISTSLDACQKPYQEVCERLGLPCFGTKEQFHVLTNKTAFKAFCRECGVDVIPDYTEEAFISPEVCAETVEFPILVKPCDSRGSRGQTVCSSYEEAVEAIAFAKSESSVGEVIIEAYLGTKNDFAMTYIIADGEAFLTRTSDRYLGTKEDRMDKSAIAGISPSVYTDMYFEKVDGRIRNLFSKLGLKNGPAFMQGFVCGDTIRFYDPGLRLPGGEYERMFRAVHGINPMKPLIEYALTGSISQEYKDELRNTATLKGKTVGNLLIVVRPGTIAAVRGLDKVRAHENVIAVFPKYNVGDTVGEHYNVNQRYGEIDLVCDSKEQFKQTVAWIYENLIIENENGDNMVFARLDPESIM